ncbi:MAG: hypothetical protein H0V17_26390 [Deltaproteobacteria bacterium]|nr:hypothetical protein [Deltaproteobacteria bacterium]
MSRIAIVLCLAACVDPPLDSDAQRLRAPAVSDAVKRDRAGLIRDSAAEMGLHNAALLGGIATSETNLAHCWEEAQFACEGPASPSCGGGPIIAGSADGPCSDEQGGLGMFQFDAGTYAQTVALYGEEVLSVEGNTAQAVSFVVDKAKLDIAGIGDWMAAVEWMDTVPMVAGDPVMEEWSHLIACRYNGCCSGSALCESRADGYRDNAIAIFEEFGGEFWNTRDRCVLPEDGIIDQRTECYVAAGEPRFWRREAGGFGDDHEFTMTTAGGAPSSYARWLLKPGRATAYSIEVHVPAGAATATSATYRIVQRDLETEIEIDQTTADGFVSLGQFELVADGSEYVELGDNTGIADQALVFDAIRVVALDGGGPGGPPDAGCCGAGDDGGSSFSLAVFVLALLLPRRLR